MISCFVVSIVQENLPSEVNTWVFFVYLRARRAAKEAKEAPAQPAPAKVKVEVKKFVKIGRPGYKGKLVAWL